MAKTWNYDNSIAAFPMQPGQLWECWPSAVTSPLGQVMVHDLYAGLPDFMRADCVFVDPPYNGGLENGYRTKAGLPRNSGGFRRFLDTLFDRLAAIAPTVCFIECSTDYVQMAGRLHELMPDAYLEVFPATYYARHACTVLRAGPDKATIPYAGSDEAAIIARAIRHETYTVIADPCMGRGLVGLNAFQAKRRFVGTELNPARLAVLLNRIHREGGQWHVDGARFEPASDQPGAVGPDREGAGKFIQPEHGGADRAGAAVSVDPA